MRSAGGKHRDSPTLIEQGCISGYGSHLCRKPPYSAHVICSELHVATISGSASAKALLQIGLIIR
jgi:hypothetical protein